MLDLGFRCGFCRIRKGKSVETWSLPRQLCAKQNADMRLFRLLIITKDLETLVRCQRMTPMLEQGLLALQLAVM